MTTPRNVRASAAPRLMDPLLGYRFVIRWDGRAVASVSRVGGLKRTTEPVPFGNDPIPLIPGQTTYEPITLERGLIVDVAFEQWANKVTFYENSAADGLIVSLRDFRKDVTIDVCNQAGQVMKRYLVFACWPSEYTAAAELDASAQAVQLESMTLQNEGWQRDDSFTAPAPLDGYPGVTHP